ncbi:MULTISPECIES: molybdopterin-dependent oxidoreductase [Desulfotignum]|jgi:thiosulfate reductase/polysulfide reductase chain A|uniref:Thiosulfate reductase PhsA n=1 Tax=Desulfotignum phosphitoxidans DSM 13687 TaxID=1286635 RepID=S0G6R9_9BACT|nr:MULTISPECIES: molybdopterin-dependent oxidoreductase [Desulfotignum]EMS80236.1 thiosulfate reductase PhsA [Desulfotignum phosphitoxidans DSM 13687]
MDKDVFSLCFMCSVRCPIKVGVKDGHVDWIQGNPHVPGIDGSLCPRGSAGKSMLMDDQRPQTPLIRVGDRGSGNWRKASWDEALDYVGTRLKEIKETHGGHAIALGERAQLSTHVSKAFLKALGSPNHFTHDALCKGSMNTACRSMFGYTDGQMGINYGNTKHIVLYGRNIFESINVKEVNTLMDALEKGARLTYIDPRVNVTAGKAHRYWMIRPGTDLALNYALMNVIIKERLYDKSYVDKWIHGFVEFQDFIKDYTPEWAEQETGIPANEIKSLAREISKVKPGVIFHYGYRCASHQNEIYMRRSILMLNALMGSVEAKGGIFFKKGPGAEGGKPARKLTEQTFPEITVPRFDKVGTPDFPLPDPAHGAPQILPYAILNEDPYPIKALINYRLETLMSIADTNNTKKALDKLDLIVTIDINYSDIAWYSDVILPESTYLERTDSVQQLNGLKPMMFLREKAVEPRYDTLEGPIILKRLGERLGIGNYFPYETMDELVDWQLEGTGFTRADFKEKGFVSYGKSQIFWDRNDIPFKTPSGKIEFKSSLLEDAGFSSFPLYESPSKPADPDKQFRLVVGRTALHTHISTQNVPYLNELMSENVLWINREKASSLGIQEGATVEVASACGKGRIKAFVTDLIHPEAVFMAHGFGHEAKKAARSYNRGLSDAVLQENVYDKVGGSPAYHDTFVTVTPV